MDPSDPYASAVQVVSELPPDQQAFPSAAPVPAPAPIAGDVAVGPVAPAPVEVLPSAVAVAPVPLAAPVPTPVVAALDPNRLLGGVVVNGEPGVKTSTTFFPFNATNRIATMVAAIARVSYETYQRMNIDTNTVYTAAVEESLFQTLVKQFNLIVGREDLVIQSDAFFQEGGLGVVLVTGLIPLDVKPGENVDPSTMRVNSIPMGIATAKEWLPVLAGTVDGRTDHTLKSAIATLKGQNVFLRYADLNLYLYSIWLDPRLS